MKTQVKHLFALLFCALLISCSSSNNNENSDKNDDATANSDAETTKKDVSELNYQDVIALIYSDDGERIEWHGEEAPNTLSELLTIASEGVCGEDDCGQAMTITNNDENKTIETIVKAAYDIEGDIGYMAWKHTLSPGETQSMGCSHLCYNGKAYLFDRQVVGSVYVEDTTEE